MCHRLQQKDGFDHICPVLLQHDAAGSGHQRLFSHDVETACHRVAARVGAWPIVAVWPNVWSGTSLLVGGTLASAIGLLLPWSLSRLNVDPAFGSGPVATILQDVLTILLYFFVMTSLLQ